MTLKQLINASGGPARCASIWGITRESVSRIIKRNSISRGLLDELIKEHKQQQELLSQILLNGSDEVVISDRKPPRKKLTK